MLFGNYRDFWIFGVVDVFSGIVVLMEFFMWLGEMWKKGNVISLWFGGFGRFWLVVFYMCIFYRVEIMKDYSVL